MDPNMYRAAMKGDLDALKQYSGDQFALQVTPNNNTVLHVAVEFGHDHCVEEILNKCPSLVSQVNDQGDTPLHTTLASWSFPLRTVELLIKSAETVGGGAAALMEMWRARNRNGDTPLHLATGTNSVLILDIFLAGMLKEENPGLDHGPNKAGETPLYLYVDRGYDEEVLSQLLETCTPSEYGGPRGRTALHAAVIGSKDFFLDILIKWKKDLIKEIDEYGWTPLHYAAKKGNVEAVRMLLDKDESVAYMTANKDEGNTALHLATVKGDTKVMEQLLLKCPDCWEMVNSKGQNILHISAFSEKDKATKYISKQPWFRRLLNRKDHDGNTPMHVLAQKREPSWFLSDPNIVYKADMKAANNEGLTPRDILLPKISRKKYSLQKYSHSLEQKMFLRWFGEEDQGDKEKMKGQQKNYSLIQKKFLKGFAEEDQGDEEKMNNGEEKGRHQNANEDKGKKAEEKGKEFETLLATLTRAKKRKAAAVDMARMAETHMVVATLISTISFAAGFTVPGGYDGDKGPNKGMAVLVKEVAFKTFVIANTIALICSTSSVFLYVSASLFDITGHEGERRARRYEICFWLIIAAMLAMMVAFSTGAYAVLAHSTGLAIATCAIACSSFIVYAFELKKHFADEEEYIMDSLSSVMNPLSSFLEDVSNKLWGKVRRIFHRNQRRA